MPVAHPASHAYGFAYQAYAAHATTTHGPRSQPQHSLQRWRQAQAEPRKKSGQKASSDERQHDERENLERVAFGIVNKVAQQALELLICTIEEVGPWRATVVRG